MIRRPPRSTLSSSSAASDVYKRQIMASLTTIPSRVGSIRQALGSIKDQLVPWDKIIVAIPDAARRFPEEQIVVPQFLTDDPEVTVVRGKDWGPATKLIPAMESVATHPEDVIVTFDDDDFYYAGVASNLLKYADSNPESIICHLGYRLKSRPARHPNFDYIEPTGQTVDVDVVAGFRGVLYRKRFFPDKTLSENLLKAPEAAMWVDDDFIGGVAGVQKVNKMAVPYSPVSYTHLRAHETPEHLVCRLLLEKKKKHIMTNSTRNSQSTHSKTTNKSIYINISN
eukprot:TRINITY_DN29726_c0_g1_i1.p1 TRINITY_DN29726_c0_g1~~TRINITY_DN29726_c0_g1_i1.p1  ORF type:complete len:283 (+),score=66.11 TRINITY_DN29726_c0_g1_i1:110-958(+)